MLVKFSARIEIKTALEGKVLLFKLFHVYNFPTQNDKQKTFIVTAANCGVFSFPPCVFKTLVSFQPLAGKSL